MALSPTLVPFILIFIPVFLGSVSAFSPPKTDTLKPGQQLRDWEQLFSSGNVFTLGFFTPTKSSSFLLGSATSAGPRYIGIWSQSGSINPVWVGNPTESVFDSSGSLSIDTNGDLKITRANASPIMLNQKPVGHGLLANVSATLLDSGNFVIRDVGRGGVPGRVLWQSFDHPTNILLPGMRIGFNLKTKKEVSVTSWISDQVPSPGPFRLGLDPSGAHQLLVWRHGEIYWSSGVLTNNGSSQLRLELSRSYLDYEFKFGSDKYMKYFSYSIKKTHGQKKKELRSVGLPTLTGARDCSFQSPLALLHEVSVFSSWLLDTLGQITVTNDLKSNTSITLISEGSRPCKKDLKNSSAICITEKPTACRKGSEYFEPKRGYMMGNRFYDDDSLSYGLSDCHGSCWRNCSCIAFRTSDDGQCQYWGKGSKFVAYDSFIFNPKIYVLDSVK